MASYDLVDYLIMTGQLGGSDFHLAAGAPPTARIDGHLRPLTDTPLEGTECRELILGALKETQRARLEQDWELDFGINVEGIGRERGKMIVTIEDPIEYVFPHHAGIVRQRQVGTDTATFAAALRGALRSNTDVIVIGEMRDLETMRIAITAADAGFLVISTLHTTTADTTVSRILDAFPEEVVDFVSSQLGHCLVGVICQHLIPRADGERGRVMASEVMVNNSGIAACIRSRRFAQIPGLIQIGASDGMHTIDDSLVHLMRHGFITADDALGRCRDRSAIQIVERQIAAQKKKP